MMKTALIALALSTAVFAGHASAQAVVGQPAPAFSAKTATGQTVALADYKGKYVVLEWTNPECPFVRKHYDSGNMPATQKGATANGAVWLAVNTSTHSSDPKTGESLQSWLKAKNAAPTNLLLDDGTIGRAYGARTTPHMYIVDPEGKLIYAGAIDSKPTSNPDDIPSSTNYVNQALGEALAGKPVSKATTQAYGCSVKYGAS